MILHAYFWVFLNDLPIKKITKKHRLFPPEKPRRFSHRWQFAPTRSGLTIAQV
jgi:hypothetical protein